MKGPALVSFYFFSFLFGGSRELQAPLSSSWSRGAQCALAITFVVHFKKFAT